MARANPVYIPRNHKVEEALEAAQAGDLGKVHRLLAVIAEPYRRRAGFEDFEEPGTPAHYQTYCGT